MKRLIKIFIITSIVILSGLWMFDYYKPYIIIVVRKELRETKIKMWSHQYRRQMAKKI